MDSRANELLDGPSPGRCGERGFSLVELMVGMVIGLATLLIMVQSTNLFESQRRTTTGSADADENGNIALSLMEADVRQGGYGLVTSNGLACAGYTNGNVANASILPVQITSPGGTANDSVLVTYGNSPAGGVPAGLVLPAPAPPAVVLKAQAPFTAAFNVGDIVLLSLANGATPCTMAQLSAVNKAPDSVLLSLAPYPAGTTLAYPAGVTYDISPQSYVISMGSLANNQYQIMCNALVVSNPITRAAAPSCTSNPATFTNASAIGDNIVVLRAQYGIAPAGSQSVNCWVNATAAGNPCDASNWAAPSLANIARIKAVRLGIVSRSYQPDRSHTEPNCTNVSGGLNKGPCLWRDTAANPAPVIDLSGTPGWQQYRYKVYSTVIPLRNVLWANL